jgi:hypothetical protein
MPHPVRIDNGRVLASILASVALAVCPPSGPVPAVTDLNAPSPDALIACVGDAPITGALFSHWFAIARKGTDTGLPAQGLRYQTMAFLVDGKWTEGEALELGIRVSDRAVRRSLTREKHANFKTEREFRQFLKSAGETRSDLKYRVRLDMLSERIRTTVAGTGSARVRAQRLSRFVTRYRRTWLNRTSCLESYRIEDCGATLAVTSAGG